MEDAAVDAVLVAKELLRVRIAGAAAIVQAANIAAGRERPSLAADHHGRHVVVVRPGIEALVERVQHLQADGVQRLGTVESDAGDALAHVEQDVVGHRMRACVGDAPVGCWPWCSGSLWRGRA